MVELESSARSPPTRSVTPKSASSRVHTKRGVENQQPRSRMRILEQPWVPTYAGVYITTIVSSPVVNTVDQLPDSSTDPYTPAASAAKLSPTTTPSSSSPGASTSYKRYGVS